MIEYDGSKCTPHGQTRCSLCASKAFKKPFVPAFGTPAPPEIAGGPPSDFEGLSVRARLPETPEEVNTDYDKIKAEVDALNSAKSQSWESTPEAPTRPRQYVLPGPSPTNFFTRDTFSTLPTDDSHASQVLRAAAEFAGTAQSWAQELAYVEKIRRELLVAEAVLMGAVKNMARAEEELKKLTEKA
jgi:hypothetical protein